MTAVSLYSTWPDLAAAEAAAEALVERRLVACATVIPGARSVYRWQGAVQHDSEVVMFAKTSAERATAARDLILALHTYDTPCVVALPLEAAQSSAAYLAWIAAETA